MINLLLETYIYKSSSNPETKPKGWRYCILTIIFLILDITFLMLYGQNPKSIVLMILSLISIIFNFIIFVLWEKYDLKRCEEKFNITNDNLNDVKDILENFEYDTNGTNGTNENWYSAKKIKYLIQSGETYIEKCSEKKTKLSELFKTIIFSIVSFIAGVILNNDLLGENDSLKEIAILISIFVLVLLIFVYVISNIINSITNLIFKSSSIEKMEKLISLLRDLLARDFEYEID